MSKKQLMDKYIAHSFPDSPKMYNEQSVIRMLNEWGKEESLRFAKFKEENTGRNLNDFELYMLFIAQ